ncbi:MULTISPECIES: DUF397 domain-containing protein [Micromonospora]|uniref:DUF397 domain-containing protein n=1 Tax=Micromonospora craniellae TaxID=2294034 RepID=A0A372FRM8_9ACTN|nr:MULTISPECIES: DUF397 domain-containing protein [Micromonospora]MDG4793041.1 DUF397 domain-containing protein [Micromonospora sp. WMMD1082]QOC93506.1 DUF397 domain-containing protein [Micromonospora craniellae]RFS43437.1 DUF397 domain-containing protein [Micromonospora craniellae]SCL35955.1 protein of unknown function [Micromonospora aurantiaca]
MIDFSRAVWRKSTRTQQSGQCVEVARVGEVIGVRDSKDPDGPVLAFTTGEFAAFLDGAAKGEFDDLV